MNTNLDTLFRQLGRATLGVLVATLSVYGLTLLCALLGFADAVISLRGVAASLTYVFVALLSLFLVSSVVAAVVRWIDRRNQTNGSSAIRRVRSLCREAIVALRRAGEAGISASTR